MPPFSPTGDSVDLAASTATARATLPTGSPNSIRITNSGSVTALLRFGDSDVEAEAATGMDLLPGTVETFRVPVGCTHLAAITAAGSVTLRITPGQGI
jgi:hypothetical protein